MPEKRRKLIFVCLGNICRSPLAEGIARDYIAKKNYKIEVDSAGTLSAHAGEEPHILSQQVAREAGIDISMLRGQKVSPYMQADYFVAMDDSNIMDLKKLGIPSDKILKMGDFGLDGRDVPDPWYGGIDGFYKVREMLDKSVALLCDKIASNEL